mmetsp:Transcript_13140/g.24698  ORF Transcript_13140/g.24698 Transcript_13140/m.24698 type:complete len:541 (-) Transcript_13140:165-1787(-)
MTDRMKSSSRAIATTCHASVFIILNAMLSYVGLTTMVILTSGILNVQSFSISPPLSSLIPNSKMASQKYETTHLFALSSSSTSSSQKEERTAEEEAFFAKTKELCKERNLSLAKIKNARDLASVKNSPVQPGRVLRTGRVSDASQEDIELLFGQMGVKTLVDLRSPTELKDDPTLDRGEVFGDFTSLIFTERKNGVVKELVRGEPRIERRRRMEGGQNPLQKLIRGGGGSSKKEEPVQVQREQADDVDSAASRKHLLLSAVDVAAITAEESGENDGLVVETISDDAARLLEDEGEEDDDDEDEEVEEEKEQTMKNKIKRKRRFAKVYPPGAIHGDSTRQDRKERHFVSIMNEIKYVKGTVSKVRKRDIAKVLIESPGALVSKRVRGHIKKPFLDEINGGGLPMLNELLLKYGAPGIHYVLDLCKDRSRHPIAFYCTAGKDRTGVITAIMLAAIGVPEEDIVEDYSLSANVYAEMNDHKAMVGALSQRSLDAKTFLGAPPQVMRDTLANIKKDWGSVEGYLDWIGFDKNDRAQLKCALTEP